VLWAKFWFTSNEPFQNFSAPEDKLDVPKVNFGTNQGG
jgi:LemA protein